MTREKTDSLTPRRDFLRIGTLAPLGLALTGALRAGARQEKACILVWQSGGCSHLDTFDMKPDAPREYRGPFRSIPTSVAGIRICEHLPRLAQSMDKVTIVRSMCSSETNHERASKSMFVERSAPEVLLAAGGMEDLQDNIWGLCRAGAQYAGTPHAAAVWNRGRHGTSAALLPASVKRAADLRGEPEAMQRLYGQTQTGEGCLRARRLVESGARFAAVMPRRLAWDLHEDGFSGMEPLLGEFDQAVSALIADLDQRGMLDTTLVIAAGEFGRAPRINERGGRDHHSKAWSVLMAGAGLPGGRVVGATDRFGAEVTDTPISPEDLQATIGRILGIRTEHQQVAASGRVIPGLLA